MIMVTLDISAEIPAVTDMSVQNACHRKIRLEIPRFTRIFSGDEGCDNTEHRGQRLEQGH
jgi:hypothetical protein